MYLWVVWNILVCIVVEGIEFECLKEILVGLIILVLFMEDFGVVVWMIKDYVKDNDKLEVKVLVIGGVLYGVNEIDRLVKFLICD